jgi:hypothetical protein
MLNHLGTTINFISKAGVVIDGTVTVNKAVDYNTKLKKNYICALGVAR